MALLYYPSVTAAVTSWSATGIVYTVPAGASAGYVTVTTDEGTSNGAYFSNQPCRIQYFPPHLEELFLVGEHFQNRQATASLSQTVAFSSQDDLWSMRAAKISSRLISG